MPGENLPRRVWNRQTKFTYNQWLVALVKAKCLSTKPTRLATGIVCHPDIEQNRPNMTISKLLLLHLLPQKAPKLAYFVLYLKIINIFLKNNICILK